MHEDSTGRPVTAPRRWRLGRRAQALLGLAAGATLLGVLVLVLVGRSDLGAHGVIVTAVLGVALLQGATILGLLYVIRAQRRGANLARKARQRTASRLARQEKAVTRRLDAVLRRLEQQEALVSEQTSRVLGTLQDQRKEARKEAKQYQLSGQRQVQALMNLRDLVRLGAAVPPATGFAASPDLLLLLVDLVLEEKPELVVECGSGLSTLFLSLAVEQHGLSTRIVALEHHEEYAAKTRALLERHGVGHRAEVRSAPLERTSLPDHETAWYSESALSDLDRIGILLVDGPPAATGPRVRFPAVPLLRDRFAPRCTIVVDDLIRASDAEIAESWSQLLPDFEYTANLDFERHVGLLKRR